MVKTSMGATKSCIMVGFDIIGWSLVSTNFMLHVFHVLSFKPCSVLHMYNWWWEFRRNIRYHGHASTFSFLRRFMSGTYWSAQAWSLCYWCDCQHHISAETSKSLLLGTQGGLWCWLCIVTLFLIMGHVLSHAIGSALDLLLWPVLLACATRLIVVQCISCGIALRNCSTIIFPSHVLFVPFSNHHFNKCTHLFSNPSIGFCVPYPDLHAYTISHFLQGSSFNTTCTMRQAWFLQSVVMN